MRPPEFWRHGEGPGPVLLRPLSSIWQVVSNIKMAMAKPAKVSIPVICVGNLNVGGTGKTPVALAIAARLRQSKIDVHFLIRGYGGRLKGPLRVDPSRHGARDVGDEALLLAAAGPTWIGADRAASARAAVADGAALLIMDDGHQNMSLAKDLSLIVIDREYGLGNGLVMPAGPLREPARQGLARADGVIELSSGGRAGGASLLSTGLPILAAHLEPVPGAEAAPGAKVVAFAGIGRPEKFFATLQALGYDIVARHTFDDHHTFSSDEIMRIVEQAASLGARPMTTTKDATRLSPEARMMTDVLAIRVEFADAVALDVLLSPLITKARAAQ